MVAGAGGTLADGTGATSNEIRLSQGISLGAGIFGGIFSRIGISLGSGSIPIFGPEFRIPPLVSIPKPTVKINIPRTTVSDEAPQVKIKLPGLPPPTVVPDLNEPKAEPVNLWDIFAREVFGGTVRVTASSQALFDKWLIQRNSQVTGAGEETGMDLGDLIGQLGGAYIQAKYASPPTLNVAASTPSFGTAGGGIPPGGIAGTPAVGIPFYDLVPEGDCKPRRRRRRKRLATASDIRDLAALKDTIGPSMTKTWIATHS